MLKNVSSDIFLFTEDGKVLFTQIMREIKMKEIKEGRFCKEIRRLAELTSLSLKRERLKFTKYDRGEIDPRIRMRQL